MHNIQSPEIRSVDSQIDWKTETKSKVDAGLQDTSDHELNKHHTETDDGVGKSFEEEDESSFRSDDLSRSDAPSDDTFQTPSSSLQNLAIIQQFQAEDAENNEIKSEIDAQGFGFQFKKEIQEPEEVLTPAKQLSPQVSLIADSEIKRDNVSPTSNSQSQPEGMNGSPVGSASSISPCNISKSSDFTQSTESNISRESNSSTSSGNNNGNNAKNKEIILLQPGTYNSKPGKKKMWYHVFTPSYKTRSNDFRKYFKELPAEERLIVDYSCAIQKEILVQGRMYISQKYVSFYANIFGWQTALSIKFKDIATITKENTALVIPNAVQIATGNEKYFFTSFVNRESTYMMLFKLWQAVLLDQNMPPKEIWKLVHEGYGEVEIGSEEEEESTEDYLSLSSTGSLANAPSVSTLHSVSDGEDTQSIGSARVCSNESDYSSRLLGQAVLTASGIVNAANIVNVAEDLGNGIVNLELIPTDLSDSSDSEDEQIVDDVSTVIPVCSAPHDDGKTVVDTIIPCDVNSLFTMLFTNSKFYLDFHSMRKTFDILQQEWQDKDGKTTRHVSFTVTLNQRMGPKHSQITEMQVLLPESKPGYFYAVDIESNNAGIPYADAFYVTCHFCLSRLSENPNQSRLIIVAQVRYRKSIWGLTKSFIEKNSWAGIEEFYSSLERSLKGECANMAIAVSPPPSPRGKAQTRRRPLRKKGPAPGIPVAGVPVSTDANANMPATVALSGDRIGVASETLIPLLDSSLILKVILSILASLLLLNAFLYIKLTRLEDSAASPVFFSHPPISFTAKEMPQNHQEWLELLQKQEALHRFELQKWHDVLLSALKILKQAEIDLESLKYHVDAYGHTRVYESNFVRSENPKAEGATDGISCQNQKYSTQPVTASAG